MPAAVCTSLWGPCTLALYSRQACAAPPHVPSSTCCLCSIPPELQLIDQVNRCHLAAEHGLAAFAGWFGVVCVCVWARGREQCGHTHVMLTPDLGCLSLNGIDVEAEEGG